MAADAKARGALGEEYCARRLLDEGWRIHARNYRCGHDEIDIVAEREGILAFIEVKARAAGCLGDPVCAVDKAKRRRLVRAAEGFLLNHPECAALQPRFDVAEIRLTRSNPLRVGAMRYLSDAFTLDDL